jgi:outer membrane immunogenic protein
MGCKSLVRLACVLVALIAAGPSLAADLPQAGPVLPPPPPQQPATYVPTTAPVYDWGGIYFGINGGYGFGQSSWTPASGTGTGNFNVSGGLVGSTLGANFQADEFVFGVEGDIDWSDIKGNTTDPTICAGCTFQTENDWLGTVRGRAGYAFDRVLVYATAGGAFGNIKPLVTQTGFTLSTNSTEFGWTAGGGVEVALPANFTVRIEYLFVDLQKGNWSCAAATCGAALSIPVSFDASLVRVGLDYKFGGF